MSYVAVARGGFAEKQHPVESGFKVYYGESNNPGHEWRNDLACARERIKLLSSIAHRQAAIDGNVKTAIGSRAVANVQITHPLPSLQP